jgi:hypothetical protein
MPIDLKALYHASDLLDQAAGELSRLALVIEVKLADAAEELEATYADPAWQGRERGIWLMPRYPAEELAKVWNIKSDLEGVEYNFTQAQMLATGKAPYQWSMQIPAEAGLINVRAAISKEINRAQQLLTAGEFTIGARPRQPVFLWDWEAVRAETVEAFRQSAGELFKPPKSLSEAVPWIALLGLLVTAWEAFRK